MGAATFQAIPKAYAFITQKKRILEITREVRANISC